MTEFKEVYSFCIQDKFFNKSGDSEDSADKLRKKIQKSKHQGGISTSSKIREMFKKQQFKEIVNWAEKDTSNTIIHEYDEIKVNSQTLKVGQNALIKNANNPSEDYVGKIQRIITINENKSSKLICLCEVRWYPRQSIIGFIVKAKSWISNSEVFSTSCTDYILASAILSPCIIYSLEEYESAQTLDKCTFFTRLGWIPSKTRFEGYSKLQNHCTCKQPLNPDLPSIQCDKCQKWYHMNCVGVTKADYDQKEYICGCCR